MDHGTTGRLGMDGWVAAAKRSAREFKADNLQDWAAALTYYGILSIFPGLLVLVSLLGLLGKAATQPVITGLTKAAPGSVRQVVLTAMTHLQHSHAAAGILATVGVHRVARHPQAARGIRAGPPAPPRRPGLVLRREIRDRKPSQASIADVITRHFLFWPS